MKPMIAVDGLAGEARHVEQCPQADLVRPFASRSSPTHAMTRFSPTSGTTSASVPMAASSRKPGSQASRDARRHNACTSFSATPTPARYLSGYEQSKRFGLMTANCRRQRIVRFVMVGDDEVDASSRARRAASAPRMPQSTEMIARRRRHADDRPKAG